RPATFGGPDQPTALLDILIGGDFDPMRRAAFPAAVRAALAGDAGPLLRYQRPSEFDAFEPFQLSVPLYTATACADTLLPRSAGASEAERLAALDAAAAAIPAARLGPFTRGAASRSDLFGLCLGWPASPEPQPPLTVLPDVPTLLLSGSDDLRT